MFQHFRNGATRSQRISSHSTDDLTAHHLMLIGISSVIIAPLAHKHVKNNVSVPTQQPKRSVHKNRQDCDVNADIRRLMNEIARTPA